VPSSSEAERYMREAGRERRVLDASLFPEPVGAELFSEPEEFMSSRAASAYATYSTVRASLPSGKLLFCIDDDPRVGAHAVPGTPDSLVTINAGTCIRLRQLFQFAVLDRESFPDEPGEEAILDAEEARFGVDPHSLLEPAELSPATGESSLDDYVHLFAPLPNTLQRRDLAQALYYAALDYVVMHEVAHIAREHASYFGRGKPIYFSETPEAGYPLRSARPELVLKVEADADLTASILSGPSLCVGDAAIAFWRGWAKDSPQALDLWLFAISMTLNLLDGWSEGPDRRSSHPHPAVRLALILMQAGWTVTAENGLDQSRLGETLHAAHFRALMAWARLGLPSDTAISRGRPFLEWEAWSSEVAQLYDEVRSTMYEADEGRPDDSRTP
jgi:hypothetical protein